MFSGERPSRTSSIEDEEVFKSKWRVGVVVLAIVVYQLVSQTRSTLFLWFARTLVHCPDTVTIVADNGTKSVVTSPKVSNMDKAWSGSPYCSNRDYVAGWAQYVVTFATTANTLCAITFVPILGSLSDKLGYRYFLE